MREVITLQLGELANYIAQHFWNTQDSYHVYDPTVPSSPINPDIHFRQGISPTGQETFLPRTVIYDFKASLGALGKLNSLYETEDASDVGWNGNQEVHKQEPVPLSAFQEALNEGRNPERPLTRDVRYWSDVTRVYFHPRSLISLDNPNMSAPSAAGSPWARGNELFRDLDREHDLLDRDFRPFLEEADRLQAVQILSSSDDIWAPFAAGFAERLRDDLGKTALVLFAAGNPVGVSEDTKRLIRDQYMETRARMIAECWEHADLTIPMGMPVGPRVPSSGYGWKLDSFWEIGGMMATAVESAMLVTRIHKGVDVGEMTTLLGARGRQRIARVGMSVRKANPVRVEEGKKQRKKNGPQEINRNGENDEYQNDYEEEKMDIDFFDLLGQTRARFRGPERTRKTFASLKTRRGLNREDIAPFTSGTTFIPPPQKHEYIGRKISRIYDVHLGYPLLTSFPHVYFKGHAREAEADVDVVLSTDDGICYEVETLRKNVYSVIGNEDRESLSNGLAEIVEEYHDGWSSGSDDDDD